MNIYNDNFSLAIFGFDIYTIKFIFSCLLVAFTLQDINNLDRFIQKHSQEALKHSKVSLLAKQALDCPVKSDVSISSEK